MKTCDAYIPEGRCGKPAAWGRRTRSSGYMWYCEGHKDRCINPTEQNFEPAPGSVAFRYLEGEDPAELEAAMIVVSRLEQDPMAVNNLVYRYECRANGASKFWEYRFTKWFPSDNVAVTRQWGRIGTIGQSTVDNFTGLDEAVTFTNKLVEEKLNKGYALVGDPPSLLLQYQAQLRAGTPKPAPVLVPIEDDTDKYLPTREIRIPKGLRRAGPSNENP